MSKDQLDPKNFWVWIAKISCAEPRDEAFSLLHHLFSFDTILKNIHVANDYTSLSIHIKRKY